MTTPACEAIGLSVAYGSAPGLRDADVTVDLTTAEGRTTLVEKVRELSSGTVDAVVANAGLATPTPATEPSASERKP